jgi:protocatechuate 3,4-dioxygenase beta subunit
VYRLIATLTLLLAAPIVPAHAVVQQETATITGTVRDASGATIAGAEVVATNTATNIVSRTLTGADGAYVIPSLRPGPYSIAIETTGFQEINRSGVTLQVAQVARIASR